MPQLLNVVIVVLEGARADHFSCHGYPRQTTPSLDRFARDGVRFTNMFSTAPATLAAHASLFTGFHSVSHGATSEHPYLSGTELLAARLKAAGYRTAAFCTNPAVKPENGFGAGFDAFFTQRYSSPLANRAVSFGRRTADRILRRTDAGARRTNLAVQHWLAAGDQPFFAFVHYNETELPVMAPPPFQRFFFGSTAELERAQMLQQQESRLAGDTDVAAVNALYDGALRYVDQTFSGLCDVLRRAGKWDDTLVIVTADHGQYLGERGVLGTEGGLDDSLLHVPLFMRCSGRLPRGFVIDELAQTTDIMPTTLSILGLTGEARNPHGRILVQDGDATPGPEFIVAERFRRTRAESFEYGSSLEPRMKCIRTRREKFIWRSDEANEFYDLVADPREQYNRIENTVFRADELRRQLFHWLAEVSLFEATQPNETPIMAGSGA